MLEKTNRSVVAALLLAFTLAAGASIAWGLVSLWTGSVISEIFLSGNANLALVFTQEGEPLVIVNDIRNGYVVGQRYRTLDGQPVEDPDPEDLQSYCGGGTGLCGPDERKPFGLDWYQRVASIYQGGGLPANW